MVPVHPLEDDLSFVDAVGPIEDEGDAVLPGAGPLEDQPGGVAWEKPPHVCPPVLVLDERSVVDDERERKGQRVGDRAGEMEASSGDERDLDAATRGFGQGVSMRVGNPAAAVEQRAVDVDGEQTNHGWKAGSACGPSEAPRA